MSQVPARRVAILHEAGTDGLGGGRSPIRWCARSRTGRSRTRCSAATSSRTSSTWRTYARAIALIVAKAPDRHAIDDALSVPARRSWSTRSRRTWRSSSGWAATPTVDGRRTMLADHVRLHATPARRPARWATAPRGYRRAAVPVELRRARAAADGEPARRSDLRGLDRACSATTSTTVWSRRRRRCSTGSSTRRPDQGGGALVDLRTLDAVRSRSSGTWPTGTPEPAGLPDEGGTPRCVPCGSTRTSRSGWTSIDDLDARAGRGAGADPRRRRVRDRPAHPRRHDQAGPVPDDARARGGRRGGGGGRRRVARAGRRAWRSTTRSSAGGASSA